jgi:DNA mismatch repair protein MutL
VAAEGAAAHAGREASGQEVVDDRREAAMSGGRIRLLPPEVIAQIAAGEVVERPFSVVKELVENALDAGATRLRVELKDGGLTRIRVTDDGRGFLPDDLQLAFVSHATSKLSQLADLDHVASLGFRGEALASIGSVSRCRIRSRPTLPEGEVADEGAEISCEGGAIAPLRPCGTPPGTVIEVGELFYNTPARRRFLKSARAERARVHDLLVRTTLPRLDVDVTLVNEDKVSLHLPAGESLAARVVRAYGNAFEGGLWEVEPTERGPYRVHGLIAEPERSRRDTTLELSWVNGRAARDRSTLYAVREAFKGHLLHGRYPVYVPDARRATRSRRRERAPDQGRGAFRRSTLSRRADAPRGRRTALASARSECAGAAGDGGWCWTRAAEHRGSSARRCGRPADARDSAGRP